MSETTVPTKPSGKKRKSTNENSSQSQEHQQNEQQQKLDKDYRVISSLLAELNEQSTEFSGKMKRLLDTVPAHDGLAALWKEQAQLLQVEPRQRQRDALPQKPSSANNTTNKKTPQQSTSKQKKPRLFTLDTTGIMNDLVMDKGDDEEEEPENRLILP